MIAVRLDKELESNLDLLASEKGISRSALIREAIIQYLEDNEDLELIKEVKQKIKSTKPLKDLRQELGLDSWNQWYSWKADKKIG